VNTKKLGLALMIIAMLSIGFAQGSFKGSIKPFPKPVPNSCPSDMLCW
jgi:hypothetical protein